MQKMKVTFWENVARICTLCMAALAVVGLCLCTTVKPSNAAGKIYDNEVHLTGTVDEMTEQWHSTKGVTRYILEDDWLCTETLHFNCDGDTLDLNGHTLTFTTVACLMIENLNDCEITDSSATKSGRMVREDDSYAVWFYTTSTGNRATLTLSGGQISSISSGGYDLWSPAELYITGGRIDHWERENFYSGIRKEDYIIEFTNEKGGIGFMEHIEHTYGDWIVDVAPTTETEGSRHKVCAICQDRVDETMPKLPTTPVDPDPEEPDPVEPENPDTPTPDDPTPTEPATPTTPTVKNDDNKVNVGAIAGGVSAAAVVVLGGVTAGVVAVLKRKQ